MRILIGLVVLLIIIGMGVSAFAMEVSGTLTEVTWQYIILDSDRYPVTDKTIIVDRDFHKDVSPYNPAVLRHKKKATIIIEHGKVKKIFIEVPK